MPLNEVTPFASARLPWTTPDVVVTGSDWACAAVTAPTLVASSSPRAGTARTPIANLFEAVVFILKSYSLSMVYRREARNIRS